MAGAAARAERDRVNREAPVLNFVVRLLGVKTDEGAWRVGANGEEKVARELAKLGPGWHNLHAVEVGDRGSDIDHVVIGPPGVITINTKCHPRGKAWVGERMIMISGQKTDYLRNSRFEAKRAGKLLSSDSTSRDLGSHRRCSDRRRGPCSPTQVGHGVRSQRVTTAIVATAAGFTVLFATALLFL